MRHRVPPPYDHRPARLHGLTDPEGRYGSLASERRLIRATLGSKHLVQTVKQACVGTLATDSAAMIARREPPYFTRAEWLAFLPPAPGHQHSPKRSSALGLELASNAPYLYRLAVPSTTRVAER